MPTTLTPTMPYVHATRIIGTNRTVYSAWMPDASWARYSTQMSHPATGEPMGKLGTERLPAEIDALPAMSEARYRAYRAWLEETYQAAYRAILEAYPEASAGYRDMGELIVEA